MHYYFSKDFERYNLKELKKADYWVCENCGFVSSKTHAEMSDDQWGSLNHSYHGEFLKNSPIKTDDPKWDDRLQKQCDFIVNLVNAGILKKGNWVDWGCGGGDLADKLNEHNIYLQKYDRYFPHISEEQLKSIKYDLVINTSVLEHVRDMNPFIEMNGLLKDDGIMAVHTLVREEIPYDPNWFYLLPVHCSFYTNKAMQIIFDKFGYKTSIYHYESSLWLWFKVQEYKTEFLEIAKKYKDELKTLPSFSCKENGFMDYWKLKKWDIAR
ncbi:MAG: class I SAM-dependent methyltransferase [Candidatus Paceibacterota bacterium]|jgi:hypothetical protein